MVIDIGKNRQFVFGSTSSEYAVFSRCLCDNKERKYQSLNTSAGIRVRFSTDSSNVTITFTTRCAEWSSLVGVSLSMGIQYIVKENNSSNGKILNQGLIVAKSNNTVIEKNIFSNIGKKRCYYELLLPSLGEVTSLFVNIDDDSALDIYTYGNTGKILFLGGPLTLGMGCSFATSMFVNRVSRAMDIDYLNLSFRTNEYLDPTFINDIAIDNYSYIITESASVGYSVESTKRNLLNYFEEINKRFNNVPIVILSQLFWGDNSNGYREKTALVQEMFNHYPEIFNKCLYIDGEALMKKEDYDKYSISLYTLNDNANALIAKNILKALQFLR